MGVQNYTISTVLSKKNVKWLGRGIPPPSTPTRLVALHTLPWKPPPFLNPGSTPEDRHVTDIPQVFHIRTDV